MISLNLVQNISNNNQFNSIQFNKWALREATKGLLVGRGARLRHTLSVFTEREREREREAGLVGRLTAVDDGELLEDVVGVAVVVVDKERPHRRLLRARPLIPAGPQRRGTPGAAPARGVLPPRGGRRGSRQFF